MLIGGVIFCSWMITGASWLMLAGVVNIYAGLGLFTIGLICLSIYYVSERKIDKKIASKNGAIILAVLLANFPVAIAAIFGASYQLSKSTLTVKNNTEHTISDLVLTERDKRYQFPIVDPNDEVMDSYHFKYEGAVSYKLTVNNVNHDGIAFGYVTSHAGGNVKMIVSRDGMAAVERMKSNTYEPLVHQ